MGLCGWREKKNCSAREHGTGTGIAVRLNLAGTCYISGPQHPEEDDFAILTRASGRFNN